MKIQDISDIVYKQGFEIFDKNIENKGTVRAIILSR